MIIGKGDLGVMLPSRTCNMPSSTLIWQVHIVPNEPRNGECRYS
jgi:hypothetical protein